MTYEELQELRKCIDQKKDLEVNDMESKNSSRYIMGFESGISAAHIAISEWYGRQRQAQQNITRGIVQRPEDI